nr:alpha/beta fold hydrolase [Lysobacter chinensis]
MHGAGGGGWEWARWRPVLEARGIGVDAPDLMPASAGWAATTLADYLEQARATLTAMPRPRLLVGASLGGLLAAAVADAADALVLVNPLPPRPWASRLPVREWPEVVPWRREARLVSTRLAIPDADPATALFAFRRWRDESGRVLREARAGIAVPRPACPLLCIASGADADVPPALTRALAQDWQADLLGLAGASHVGPLLGREAPTVAEQVAGWLQRVG